MAKYPTREPYFAQKAIRLLVKTAAAQHIGQTAALLVVTIATTEDAARYRRPVTFYNGQLMMLLGLHKWETLDRARRVAAEAGWLCYVAPPSGKRKPGLYWVTIPPDVVGLDDSPVDEAYPQPYPQPYTENGYGKGDGMGYGRGYGMGELSELTLSPNPTLSSPEATSGEEASESANGKPKPDKLQELIDRWNRIDGIQHVRQPTQKRRTALAARMRDGHWRESVPEALSRISKSSFCGGGGEKGWRADIDWFLRPDTVTRILEGKYDDRDKITNNQPPPEGLY